MKKEVIVKYGIKKCSGGYCPTEIEEKTIDGKPYIFNHSLTGLVYKKPDFALKKSESFFKSLRKDFVNFQGDQISFKFVNLCSII